MADEKRFEWINLWLALTVLAFIAGRVYGIRSVDMIATIYAHKSTEQTVDPHERKGC